MQLAGTIAVVVSVLVLAFQARELARQSRIANQVAAAQAERDLIQLVARTSDVFISHPELRGRFFDEAPAPRTEADARLLTIADQHADMIQTLLETTATLRVYGGRRQDENITFANSLLAASTHLRTIIRDNPGFWPPLEPLLADFEAKHKTVASH
jgi:hypothetical protein